MSGFIRQLKFKTEFDGDTVSITMDPCRKEDFIQLLPLMGAAKDEDESVAVESITRISDIVQQYVVDITGIVDSEGGQVTREEIFGCAYFVQLVSELFQQWMEASTYREKQKVNKLKKE